ncbi:cytochrome c oxidase assembly protein COX11, mitochondrial isoform X2 [Bufo gargarizans]|uniref:cytochrome c oxidase assembly protein COX11, mitochondrial isoform X2 n=1 Tax=Bufo bufo TaxID=8384 RepID=UPI001ABE3101|nr:cytochrome c oxidase assembly protein COX11, mitochondrial isoform X2 [Bufo bufo]XP_044153190.1 cytochrome c oxidase assembly protein COX11, mitochondrial isoform X2 [Bufo gargarizans]
MSLWSLWRVGCRGTGWWGALREPARCCLRGSRGFKSQNHEQQDWRSRNKTVLTYVTATVVGMVGMSYAAVPLYRLYCQSSGLGGAAVAGHSSDQIEAMQPVKDRVIKVTFNADVHASLHWNFRPQQTEIYCFCFEEQRLNPHEEVDMPVFFFIDPEFAEDPRMANVENIMLSYTFFEAKEGHKLPLPGYS